MPRTRGPAKYYIYRNLNRGKAFSIKHRGRVVLVTEEPIVARNVGFNVSEKGWNRARTRQARNVHAFAVADSFVVGMEAYIQNRIDNLTEVWYNPFRSPTPHFRLKKGEDTLCVSRSSLVIFSDGKAWI